MDMKKAISRFIHNEDGSELMQWAIIIIIVVGLAIIGFAIAGSVESKLNEAKNQLDSLNSTEPY